MLVRTTAINKIIKLKKRVKIIQGGTSAGKTFGILPILIDMATKKPNIEISVVAESIPHLRRGALKDFLNIMKWTGRYFEQRFNKSLLNWKVIDKLPDDARLLGYGVDFGYSVDPSSVIEVYNYNGERILNEICYETGLVNTDIAKKLQKTVIAYADSSEPKSIEEIRRTGQVIKGVRKGADSINFGIQIMQSQSYLVTSKSSNLIKELRAYCWDKDRTGKQLAKPTDSFNHAVDAVRYHEMESLGRGENFGKYTIS